jgi:hypothetical protein
VIGDVISELFSLVLVFGSRLCAMIVLKPGDEHHCRYPGKPAQSLDVVYRTILPQLARVGRYISMLSGRDAFTSKEAAGRKHAAASQRQ